MLVPESNETDHSERILDKQRVLKENIEKLGKDVVGYLKYFTNDLNLAWDLTQETILKNLDFLSKENDPSKTKPYLLKTARNLAIDHFRKFNKEQSLDLDIKNESKITYERNPVNPELLMIAKEEKETIVRFFGKLKPSEKEILTLYYYNDLNLEEIAKLLDIPLNTAITKLCRARRELKNKMLKDKTYEMSY